MQIERVRRINEPRDQVPLCETRECWNCGITIEGGGMALGKRWLHLTCIEVYVENLEQARDYAIAESQNLRQMQQQMKQWNSASGTQQWTQMPDGSLYTTIVIGGGSGGGSGGVGGLWTSTAGGMNFQSFPYTVTGTTSYLPTASRVTEWGLVTTSGP